MLPYQKWNTKPKDLLTVFHTLKRSQTLAPEKRQRDILFQETTEGIEVGSVLWTNPFNK
jgi:hypothetical protein